MHKLTQTIVDYYDGRDGEIIWDQRQGRRHRPGLRVREGGSAVNGSFNIGSPAHRAA